ncbi:esterase family protein, partial [Rhodococcus erythropolis]|nr:esterase family protein [Rhodococcus erythropolis]
MASKAGDATNMWGPASDPDWQKHDPSTNAETLRGKTIYVSSGTGAPGEYDNIFTPGGLQTAIEGGPLEALANTCTQLFEARLGELSIP